MLLVVAIVTTSFLPSRAAAVANCRHDISNVSSAASLDSIIRGHAFGAVARGRSGVVYRVPLPAELSGIEAAAVKLRGSSFRRDGVNVDSFRVPKNTLSSPYARRMVFVYQNLGDWSPCYYNVRNYSPATPVVSLLAYDRADNSALELRATGAEPISVAFPYVRLPEGLNSSSVKCARFGPTRGASADLRDARGWQGCSAKSAGRFMMVFPSSEATIAPPPPPPRSSTPAPPPDAVEEEEEELGGGTWQVWLIACGCGVAGSVALVLLAVGIVGSVRRKRMREMERNSEEGVVLDSMWVGGGKMPSASMTRTRPVLEDGGSP